MDDFIIEWNVRAFHANFGKLTLLGRQSRPAVIGLQETFITDSNSPSCTVFSILTIFF